MSVSPFLPLVLCVLDGWGVRDSSEGNAIRAARPENLERLAARYPHMTLRASGSAVGLPRGQIGNSEVGHLTIGAGRVVEQILTRVLREVGEGTLARNGVLDAALQAACGPKGSLHLMGLLSDGGVHSHQAAAEAVVRLAAARGLSEVRVHAFLDGRDTPPRSALEYLSRLQGVLDAEGVGSVASVSGRFYAMDRDGNWGRTEKAWRAMVAGQGRRAASWEQAVREAYERGESDEFVEPTVIAPEGADPAPGRIGDGASLLFFNFRADRSRQIARTFTQDDFDEFPRPGRPELARFTGFAPYDPRWNLPAVFEPENPGKVLGQALAEEGLRQVRIAETEKYAHVTYFLNGGREEPFAAESRVLIPSRKMKSYADLPEMQAGPITDAVEKAVGDDDRAVVVVNYANADMVGHSGDMDATVQACRVVDRCVGRLARRLRELGGVLIVTADHGNAELMVDPRTGGPHTAHTTSPVPFVLAWEEARGMRVPEEGGLRDVAATLLSVLGLPAPSEWTGRDLLRDEG